MEAEIGVMCLLVKKWPEATDAGGSKKGCPESLRRECEPADLLIPNFWLQELKENTFLSFKPPILWCFVTALWETLT